MTQKEALDILKCGHNVYLTGSAGSGKTYVLNQYIKYLKDAGVEVAVTASTGIAATHMNGITIHSWSGLGIRDTLDERDLDELEERKYLWDRIQRTKVLIIDEVSMLHHFRLDLIEQIVRTFKRNDKPFGGIQVVLCGDFFQLPPVARRDEPEPHFIYESEAWRKLNLTICYLKEQHRQTDADHVEVLNSIRRNEVDEQTYAHLKSRHNKEIVSHVEPTRLYTHNIDVDSINTRELGRLEGESRTFSMTSRGRPAIVETIKKSCLAPEHLALKIGARVMFVKNNFEAGYVNGTLGKVVGFENGAPVVEIANHKRIVAEPMPWKIEEDGKTKAEISQVPLRLAWAITIHKSQGMSLDAAEIDLSKSFEKGMGYVALSRVRSLQGLKLLGLNSSALDVCEDVLSFDTTLQDLSKCASEELGCILPEVICKRQQEFLASIKPPEGAKKKIVSTYEKTRLLVLEKLPLKEIAKNRKKAVETIIGHLETLVEDGKLSPGRELLYLKPPLARFAKMEQAFRITYAKSGDYKLSPVRTYLGPSYDFEELRLARLFLGISTI